MLTQEQIAAIKARLYGRYKSSAHMADFIGMAPENILALLTALDESIVKRDYYQEQAVEYKGFYYDVGAECQKEANRADAMQHERDDYYDCWQAAEKLAAALKKAIKDEGLDLRCRTCSKWPCKKEQPRLCDDWQFDQQRFAKGGSTSEC